MGLIRVGEQELTAKRSGTGRPVADWATVSSRATAAGMLALAIATFSAARFLPAQPESKFGPEAPAIPTNGDNCPQLRTSGECGVPAETA